MSNTIKYSESTEQRALNKGNWYIGTGDVSKGPTETTGYWSGLDSTYGKYIVYKQPDVGEQFSVTVGKDVYGLITILNQFGFTGSTYEDSVDWLSDRDDIVVFNNEYPSINTSDLLLNIDGSFIGGFSQNDVLYDLSINNNNGTAQNDVQLVGGNLVFDGTDDVVNFGNILNFSADDEFTISVWFFNDKPLVTQDDLYGLVSKYISNGINGWSISLRGGSYNGTLIRFSSNGEFDDVTLTGVTNALMSDGKLHNITVTYDSEDLCSVYVDGELKGTKTFSSYDFTNSGDLLLGYFNQTSNPYEDRIRQLQIYGRSLTSDEVSNNYDKFFNSIPKIEGGDYIYNINLNGEDYRVHAFYDTSELVVNKEVDIDYMIVAGGGGGGGTAFRGGGGGGAGGIVTNVSGQSLTLSSTTYNIIIGAGGSGSDAPDGGSPDGYNGNDSEAFGLIAYGGGGGGRAGVSGKNGGSGGGAGGSVSSSYGGSPVSGQGNKGGDNIPNTRVGSGGGGYSEPGQDSLGSPGNGGNGGDFSQYFGTDIGDDGWFGGGGGGGRRSSPTLGVGGKGGGGKGQGELISRGEDGMANTGGGGGGIGEIQNAGPYSLSRYGGNGGSGVVVIRYKL